MPSEPSSQGPAPERDPESDIARGRAESMTVDELLRHVTPRTWVTPLLTALILVMFAYELVRGVSPISPTSLQLLEVGASFGPFIHAGEPWRVLSAMFLHAGVVHLAFNVFVFWRTGMFTERVFGNVAFLAIYLLSGIGGELASLVWNPFAVSVGASGAVFGVYGALLSFVVLHRGVIPASFLVQQRSSLLAFVGYNVVFGLAVKSINLAAHAGGFAVGVVLGGLLGRDLLKPKEGFLRRLGFVVGVTAGLGLLASAVDRRIERLPEVQAVAEYVALSNRAWNAMSEGRYAESLAAYDRLLTLREPDASTLNNRAWLKVAMGDFAGARIDADGAVALNARSAAALGTRCFALVGLGMLDEARSDCAKAVELEPTGALNLGMIAFIDHRYDEARELWIGSIKGDATRERELHQWLARIPP